MTIDPGVVIAIIGALATGLGTAASKVYIDMRKDRDWWRDRCLAFERNADKAIKVAASKVSGA